MNRFGINPAPDGCGDPGDGACEGCIMRRARRGRWMLRQLVPLTYRTRYHTVAGWDDNGETILGPEWFVVWRMWFGRVFDCDRVQIGEAAR